MGAHDLRLVPAAGAAWLAAAGGVRATAGWAVCGLGVALAIALVLAALALPGPGRRRAGASGAATALGTALVALAAAAAVLGSCAVQLAARDTGPVTAAAAERAVVVVTGVVAEPMEADRVPWSSDAVGVRGTVHVTALTVRGSTVATRAEVLARGAPDLLDHPPGTSVRLTGRLGPLDGRAAAALAVTGAAVLAAPGPVDAAVARLRAGLLAATDGLPADARGLVPGAAVGDRSRLDPGLADAMRAAGLSHLVAVSGQHVVVVVLAAFALAGLVRAPRVARAAFAGSAALAFSVLVGGGPAVLRAVATGVVGAAAVGLGRRARPVPVLAAVVVGLCIADPWATGSLGFQLSVVATAAIVVLAGPAAAALGGRREWLRRRLPVVTVPLAAQSAVGPVLVLVDPVVSPWAVVANVLAAPAVVPTTLLGLGATLAAPAAPAVASVLARVAAVPAGWIAAVARVTAGLPGARTAWAPGAAGAIALAALTAAAWFAARALLAGPPGGGRRHRDVAG